MEVKGNCALHWKWPLRLRSDQRTQSVVEWGVVRAMGVVAVLPPLVLVTEAGRALGGIGSGGSRDFRPHLDFVGSMGGGHVRPACRKER